VRYLALLACLGCTRANPDLPVERCVAQGACGNGVYSLCTRDGCNTRFTASTASFQCATCGDCQSALTQVTFFCAGGGGTTGGGGDAACATMVTGCVDCCVGRHTAGYNQYLSLLKNCECGPSGACKTECAASFCLDPNQADSTCNNCLTLNSGAGGVCDITAGCSLNADCAALLACATPCPP
jgi:hypothetical protein